jgi:hypothetical protein
MTMRSAPRTLYRPHAVTLWCLYASLLGVALGCRAAEQIGPSSESQERASTQDRVTAGTPFVILIPAMTGSWGAYRPAGGWEFQNRGPGAIDVHAVEDGTLLTTFRAAPLEHVAIPSDVFTWNTPPTLRIDVVRGGFADVSWLWKDRNP